MGEGLAVTDQKTHPMTIKPTCIHCGTLITAITYRLNDGFCMPCCDPFPGIKGAKHLLTEASEADVEAELAERGITASATFHRWLRIKSRVEPGDRLVRFRSELQQTMPRLHEGVVWQRGSETLSGIVTHTEWLTTGDEWLGENLRFATPEEIHANPALRAQVHPGDRVMHYLNRDPEGIAEDGREGFVVVRAKRCVARVVLSVA